MLKLWYSRILQSVMFRQAQRFNRNPHLHLQVRTPRLQVHVHVSDILCIGYLPKSTRVRLRRKFLGSS
jgi:hypothetical protein